MFPNKKYLFFNDGWEDLGKTQGTYISEDTNKYMLHAFCNRILHVGKENNELFKFCPGCKVKVTEFIKK